MVGSAPTDGTHAAQPCPLRSLALLPPMLRDFAGLAAGVDSVDVLPSPASTSAAYVASLLAEPGATG